MTAWIVRDADGGFELLDWSSSMSRDLADVVRLADPDVADPAARGRLYPEAGDREEEREAWRRHAHPELHALFAAAQEIVRMDLTAARRGPSGAIRRLRIPPQHVPAWIAALNTARLHLAAVHGVDAAAMAADPDASPGARGDAVAKIELLAELQWELIAGTEPTAGDPRGDGAPPAPPEPGGTGGAAGS